MVSGPKGELSAAQTAYNRGNAHWRARRLVEAARAYELALTLDPGLALARLNLGNVRLAMGQEAEGWALYDERPERKNSEARKLSFPEWQGEPLAGKRLFVWPEQGWGDQIFAARYIRHLQAAQVSMVCETPLVRLFSSLGVEIIERRPQTAVGPHWDFWAMPLSLPRWVGPVPLSPYLHGSGPRRKGFGVVWRGKERPDPGRSLPAALGAELLALPGAMSLHPEDTGARDFQDTADIIAGLDLVVSIDTSVAHLAGALGKRTILLLQHDSADWRWEQARYPAVEIVRQRAQGEWQSALHALKLRLRGEG